MFCYMESMAIVLLPATMLTQTLVCITIDTDILVSELASSETQAKTFAKVRQRDTLYKVVH